MKTREANIIATSESVFHSPFFDISINNQAKPYETNMIWYK